MNEPMSAEELGAQNQAAPEPRWALSESKLDIFWLILAAILVVAVVFVVSVAHNSMNDVGTLPVPRAQAQPAIATATTSETIVIVQASSYRGRDDARAAAAALTARGFQAKVLDSNDYRPMNPNWYVVYTGPYPATADGRAEAKRVAARLPEAFTREINHH